MQKVVSVTIRNFISNKESSSVIHKFLDLKEINDLLSEGWQIEKTDYVNSNIAGYFSVIFTLVK